MRAGRRGQRGRIFEGGDSGYTNPARGQRGQVRRSPARHSRYVDWLGRAGFTGLGLVIFGGYSLAEGRWRRG